MASDTTFDNLKNIFQTASSNDEAIKKIAEIIKEKTGEERSAFSSKSLQDFENEIRAIKNLTSVTDEKIREITNNFEDVLANLKREQRLHQEINAELLLEERALQKQLELRGIEEKRITHGLTLEEKKHAWLIKQGEAHGLNTDKIKTGLSELKKVGQEVKGIFDNWLKIDEAASDYTRRMGGSLASLRQMRKEAIDLTVWQGLGSKYNINAKELIELQGKYNLELGRGVQLTKDQQEGMSAMRAIMGDEQTVEFATKLENFGLNESEVEKRVATMFKATSKHGVAFEKTSKNFLSNIQMANSFTFKNGLNGLASMAEKATAIKLDMQQVARAAEKVSTLEGAMGAGAQLSVLGGGFAQFGNPLTMMYEGLNDMEGLQDRIVKMFGGMGKWNMEKGQVDISVFNKQRIKAAAQAMGMDANNLFEMINTQARRGIVEKQLAGGLNKDTAELIKNQAQIDTETGRAYVTINGEKRDVSQLGNKDYQQLLKSTQDESADIKDIALDVRSITSVLEGNKKQFQDAQALGIEKTFGNIDDKIRSWFSSPIFANVAAGVSAIVLSLQATNALLTIIASRTGSNIKKMASEAQQTTASEAQQTTTTTSPTSSGGGMLGGLKKAFKPSLKATGVGIGLGVAGMAGDYLLNKHYQDKEKGAGYKWGKAATGAAKGAAMGAFLGWGGMAVGAAIGGAVGYYQAHKEAESERILRKFDKQGKVLNGQYDYDELKLMEQGKPVIQNGHPDLVNKMIQNGDWDKFALGGIVGRFLGRITGRGSATSDSVPILASNGEYVVSAKGVEKNLPVLEEINKGTKVMPVGDLMNSVNVAESNGGNKGNSLSTKLEPITFEPLKIDLSGTLNLQVNGEMAKQIKPEEIITPQVTDAIIREIHKRTGYGLRRQNLHEKFH